MKKFIFFILATVYLFASCDTSSYNAAYNDYYKYQQKYIESLLDNNKKSEINSLNELIKCGKYLNFNVSVYQKKLKALTKNKPYKKMQKKLKTKKFAKNIEKKTKTKQTNKKQNIYLRYIKIHKTYPLDITIPSNNIRHFIIHTKKSYKEVIDIKNAVTPKFIKKRVGNILIKIAQFNKNTVRVVYSSNKKFSFDYKIKNSRLYAWIKNDNTPSVTKRKVLLKPLPFRRKKTIVLDPGHGGKDSGGIGLHHRYEKTAVLQIALKAAKILRSRGYRVYLTRSGDYFIPLQKRTHFANIKKADIFVSIHCNIAPHHIKGPNGIEVYYLSPSRNERAIRVAKIENKEIKGLNYLDQSVILNFLNRDRIVASHKVGIDVINAIVNDVRKKGFHLKNGGVRPAPFWVLVGTQMPAILIETGYLTNPGDERNLFNPLFQWQVAKGIADGITNYFKKNP